jgi:ligand-binding sensor domain-containing protein
VNISACALNPGRDIHQLAHRTWGEEQGYPGRAEALAQTTDGFLWVGTDNGLFRFDGVRFEGYVPGWGDKLSEGPVRGLRALPDGSLWIAYRLENRICVLRSGNVKAYGKAEGVTSNPTNIVQDHEGTIWANTETGVLRFNGTRWDDLGENWNFPINVPHVTSDVLP